MDFLDDLVYYNDGRNVRFSGHSSQYIPSYITDKFPPDKIDQFPDVYRKTLAECDELIKRIKAVDPLVIDYFFSYNRSLADIGKFLISLAILNCQRSPSVHEKLGNWCRYLIHHLMMGCENPDQFIESNKVSFVTFNYDNSLRNNILVGLKENEFFANTQIVEEFLSDDRILHVYGNIQKNQKKDYPPSGETFSYPKTQNLNEKKPFYDRAYDASKGIYTIAPADKLMNQAVLDLAKQKIDEAEYVYILGYGFDRMNSKNLALDELLNARRIRKHFRANQSRKYIFFTNYNNMNIISKRASELFFKRQDAFLPPNTPISGDGSNGYVYEMSTKNVYEALSQDFELPD